jgi:hypothetical protein
MVMVKAVCWVWISLYVGAVVRSTVNDFERIEFDVLEYCRQLKVVMPLYLSTPFHVILLSPITFLGAAVEKPEIGTKIAAFVIV